MDYDLSGEGRSVLLPDGWNVVRVVDVSVGESKSGNEMYIIVTEEPTSGSVDKTYAITTKGKAWFFRSFVAACGFVEDENGIYKDVTPEACIGMSVEAQNKAEPNEFTRRDGEVVKEMRNKFVLFRPAMEKATL